MSHEGFAATLALIGLVILVSSLLSGATERTGLPLVAIYLTLGAMLGPAGLGLVELRLESESLQVIATLGLVLVLFIDAIGVDTGELRAQRRLALAILGPGTLIPALLIALAAWLLLDLSLPAAGILGAALASTDPVLLRTLMRHPAMPPLPRLGLRLESGMNDVVLLPIVVLCMLALRDTGVTTGELSERVVGLFLLGPFLGAATGYTAITLLDQVRKRVGVRRDYESLYALGVAFTAFSAAEATGGSGFLAAFAAGLVIAALDVELCDCFLDYGEASAEMFLLLTFVAFGASIIWSGVTVADGRTLLFAILALAVRTLVMLPVLARVGVSREDRRLIAWMGPRGLSSLLLALLPVFAGVPLGERLFAITCLVVLISVVIHGGGIAWYLRRHAVKAEPVVGPAAPAAREARAAPAPASAEDRGGDAGERELPVRITLDEVRRMMDGRHPFALLDVRTERSWRDDRLKAVGSRRFPPDDAVRLARERRLDPAADIILYCT
ncbi:MAG TPA: cation:proton antiporter [Gemmatimonadales bacterium]|nr:cation:proton antiporter [Gemmatimonadales bacterium]